jgi:hypothetical protein
MTVIDVSSRITVVSTGRVTVIDLNEIWLGMFIKGIDGCEGPLTKGVDGCKDISSRMGMLVARGMTTDFDAWRRFASRMIILDSENWLKYGIPFQIPSIRARRRM